MMRVGHVRVLLLVALTAACAPQEVQPTAAPRETDAPHPVDASEAKDRAAAEAPLRQVGKSSLEASDGPRAAAFRDLAFVRSPAEGIDVLQEVRRGDVRDTERRYDEKLGTMTEVPIDGTSNPAKVMQNKEWATKADDLLRRDVVLVLAAQRRFQELFGKALPASSADAAPLDVVVLWNRASFDRVRAAAGSPVPAYVRAAWLPDGRGVVTYLGDESLQVSDEWMAADGRVQKESDRVVAAACTALLLRRHGGWASTPRWLRVGLPVLLGGVETQRDDLAKLSGPLQYERVVERFVAESRAGREASALWTVEELMKPQSWGSSLSGAEVDPAVGWASVRADALTGLVPDRRDPLMSLAFQNRAWAFCHFLWHYDGGKYRDRFVEFVGRALRGEATKEMFAADVMGRPNASDWGDVEMEFEWYWSKLLDRKVGRDKVTKQWYEPSTDPPEGTVEADFREMWAETHKSPAAGEKK